MRGINHVVLYASTPGGPRTDPTVWERIAARYADGF